MDLAERYLYFRSMPGGPRFSDLALLPLAEHAEEVVFRRRTRLLAAGTPAEYVYFLMQGVVDLIMPDGTTRGTISAPGVVGVFAVMADVDMTYDVIARDEVVALAVESEFFRETFEDNFDVALEIIGSLSRQLLALRPHLPRESLPSVQVPGQILRLRRLGLVERMLVVRRFDLFGPGALTGLTEIAQLFQETELAEGELLFRAGEHADTFHLLLSGELSLRWPDSVETVHPGPPISNLETFAGRPREATAVVTKRARILYIAWEALVDVLEDHTDMALEIISRLAQVVMLFAGSSVAPPPPPAAMAPSLIPAAPTSARPRPAVPLVPDSSIPLLSSTARREKF